MTVDIEFDEERGTCATLTMRPSWLARLVGRRPRIARIFWSDAMNDWRFVDGGWVGSDLEERINDEQRWRMAADLPSARVLETP
jgi:hypothetical protein